MSVFRHLPEGDEPFTQIINATLRDHESLSLEALGLLVTLVSRPPDWEVIGAVIRKEWGIGKDKFYRIVDELLEARYLTREVYNDENGHRVVSYGISSKKIPDDTASGFTGSGSPASGFQEATNIDNNKKKINTKSRAKTSHTYSDEFETWWKIYPKPVDKRTTFGCWNATLRERGGTVESIMNATSLFAKKMFEEGREKRHILNSTTFLGPGERWREYLPAIIDPEVLVAAKWWDLYDRDAIDDPDIEPPFGPRPTNADGQLLDGVGRTYYHDPMQPGRRRYFDDE